LVRCFLRIPKHWAMTPSATPIGLESFDLSLAWVVSESLRNDSKAPKLLRCQTLERCCSLGGSYAIYLELTTPSSEATRRCGCLPCQGVARTILDLTDRSQGDGMTNWKHCGTKIRSQPNGVLEFVMVR
jgi:hypothetical protein